MTYEKNGLRLAVSVDGQFYFENELNRLNQLTLNMEVATVRKFRYYLRYRIEKNNEYERCKDFFNTIIRRLREYRKGDYSGSFSLVPLLPDRKSKEAKPGLRLKALQRYLDKLIGQINDFNELEEKRNLSHLELLRLQENRRNTGLPTRADWVKDVELALKKSPPCPLRAIWNTENTLNSTLYCTHEPDDSVYLRGLYQLKHHVRNAATLIEKIVDGELASRELIYNDPPTPSELTGLSSDNALVYDTFDQLHQLLKKYKTFKPVAYTKLKKLAMERLPDFHRYTAILFCSQIHNYINYTIKHGGGDLHGELADWYKFRLDNNLVCGPKTIRGGTYLNFLAVFNRANMEETYQSFKNQYQQLLGKDGEEVIWMERAIYQFQREEYVDVIKTLKNKVGKSRLLSPTYALRQQSFLLRASLYLKLTDNRDVEDAFELFDNAQKSCKAFLGREKTYALHKHEAPLGEALKICKEFNQLFSKDEVTALEIEAFRDRLNDPKMKFHDRPWFVALLDTLVDRM